MQLKKIIIPDIYLEPGVTFESFYDYKTHTDLQNRLNDVYIDDGLMLDEYKDFQLIIRTSPTLKDFEEIEKKILTPVAVSSNYILCQPLITKQKDYKAIEFFVYLSYTKIVDSKNDPLELYISTLKVVLTLIFKELKFSEDNIDKIVSSINK